MIKWIMLSVISCMTITLFSQSTVLPNDYTKRNISYLSDPDNIIIKRFENLKGDVSSITSDVYNINKNGNESYDPKKSFRYNLNKEKKITSAVSFYKNDKIQELINYNALSG